MKHVPWSAVVLLLGLAAVTVGVALIYLPAGIIAGGAQLVYCAIALDADSSREATGTTL